jgi:osmoprotectant transport system permease protein
VSGRWRGLGVRALVLALGAVAFVYLLGRPDLWGRLLSALFPGQQALYPGSLMSFTGVHVQLVAASSGLAIAVGVLSGILLTRRRGRPFLPLVSDVVSLGQTFPPVAVIALTFPALGFGFAPSLVALFLYGLLPIVRNTVAGLDGVSPEVIEASRGMGMSPIGILTRIELPLAARVIMAGVRTSVVINVGTATIAAAIGVGDLGAPIIGGLATLNSSFVLEGALAAAGLAILIDAGLGLVQAALIEDPRLS